MKSIIVIDHFHYFSIIVAHQVFWWNHVVLDSESSTHSVNQVFDTKMYNKKLHPVCCRHLGNTLHSTGPISDPRSPWRNHVRHTGNHSETPLSVYYCHGGYRTSHYQVGWCWSSRFWWFANLVANSLKRCFRPVIGVWDVVFQWIPTGWSMARQFQTFSGVVAADWTPMCSNAEINWSTLGQSQQSQSYECPGHDVKLHPHFHCHW